MNHDSAFVNAFDHLSPEEKKQLALLGSMLARPVSEEEQEIQRLLDACVDAREKGLSLGTSEGKGPLSWKRVEQITKWRRESSSIILRQPS
jgi:hypothetical protein